MTTSIDAIHAIHNAFRNDISRIDAAALDAARGKPGLALTVERFRLFNDVLGWHAQGEDSAVGPLLESVAPSVYASYERDHRGLDALFASLSRAVSARDALETARATKAFKFHLELHLEKEETHMYPLLQQRVSVADIDAAVGKIGSDAPAHRFPEVVAWMFSSMNQDDRLSMTLVWKQGMPAPVFADTLQLIRQAVGDDWAALARRIPCDVGPIQTGTREPRDMNEASSISR